MASKKKRNRPRPPSGPRPAAKAGGPAAKAAPPVKSPGQARPAASTKAAPRPAKEKSGPTRAERLAAAEAARRRKAVRNRALVLGGIVGLVALIAVTVTNSRRSNARIVDRLEASGACEYDTRSDSLSPPPGNHVTGNLTYEVNPPAGGNHNPSPAPPGVFTAANTPPDSQIVHSLEHGYVAIWHRPDIAPAQLDELRSLAGRHDRDALLVPRPSLSEPVAATAWGRRLLCSETDIAALERFVTAYRNKGPEKVEH